MQTRLAEHWLFSRRTRHVVDWRPIPFYIRPVGEHSLHEYARSVARTVPLDQRTDVREGEILVTVFKRSRPKVVSIHPKHLVPWEPIVGGEVIVTNGDWVGALGVVKERKDKCWVISITLDNESQDKIIEETDLAALDPRK